METLSYFFIFLPGIQWNSGRIFGGIHVFLGIKTWNTVEVFIETRRPSAPGFNETSTGFKFLPQKTRETAKNPPRVSLKPGKQKKNERFPFKTVKPRADKSITYLKGVAVVSRFMLR